MRVHITGNQRLLNQMVCYFLAQEGGMQCTEGLMDELDASRPPRRAQHPSVFLMDYGTREVRHGLRENLDQVADQVDGSWMIVFNFNDEALPSQWVSHGVRGLLYQTEPRAHMVNAVKSVAEGHLWFPRQAMSKCLQEMDGRGRKKNQDCHGLTNREREILAMVASGKSNAQVGDLLFISRYTVKVHLQKIYRKIQVPNRVQAALWAHHNLDLDG